MAEFSNDIELLGVKTHNLKGVDARIPLYKLTIVTGVSGSGKSSLVFDTLYSEAYRRYVESLSSFARQYLKALPKPVIERVRNLPPAIAVRQARMSATARSTVGTVTELNDILRVLFAHAAKVFCHQCGEEVCEDNGRIIFARVSQNMPGARILILAPLERWDVLNPGDLKAQLLAQGFTRAFVNGETLRLEDLPETDVRKAAVVIDRVQVEESQTARITDSADLALRVGKGQATVRSGSGQMLEFTSDLTCPRCRLDYLRPSMSLLSFNHPLGACERCQGFGYVGAADWNKVIPDKDQSLATRGVEPWNFGQHAEVYSYALASAKRIGLDPKKPFSKYTKAEWQWLATGSEKGGREAFTGVEGYFAWLESKRYKPHYRIHAARFRRYVLCPICSGARLNPKAIACKINGVSIADVSRFSIAELKEWFSTLEAMTMQRGNQEGGMGLQEALDEGKARLGYLTKIGVGYLSVDRKSRTLSGGELQRINMARCLGSALTDTLFCLDEPTTGLHARDSRNLVEIMYELRDQGNTVVVVEHERGVIAKADHLIEVGPKAGHLGGEIVFAGNPLTLKAVKESRPEKVYDRFEADGEFIELQGAKTHNLKNLDIKIPVGAMTGVCGVSGSGKTSLIQHTLFPALAKILGQKVDSDAEGLYTTVGPQGLIKRHADVALVSQTSLGRSSRSNIATYLGFFDEVRKLFASTPLAQKNRLDAGDFSFNTAGGRCETCRGLGSVVEDLSFLGEMEVICPSCAGRRFEEKVINCLYNGKSILDVLSLTILEARGFFHDRPHITRALDALLQMGLGYITLGQHTSSFSGGEIQRLKMAALFQAPRGSRPSMLIFDEPSSGLSDEDVKNLIVQLKLLTKKGHTIIVVEHHLDLLRACDWLLEIGPEAADAGGELVFQGPPAQIKSAGRSITARFMWGKENL